MAKILLVEDDAELADIVSSWLSNERFTVEWTGDGLMATDMLRLSAYDVIVLDWDLPGLSGIEVLKRFRAAGGATPVIMLTGKNQLEHKEEGLGMGADDYLTKPFQVRELSARIRAMLRRPANIASSSLRAGNVELDSSKHRVTVAGKEVHLLPRDFALLEFLLRHKDEVFSSESLISRVWSADSEASADGLRTAIKRIRQKIDGSDSDSGSIIENIPRIGYRLRDK